MSMLRNMEINWDDLIEAFENTDPELIYLLDRSTGEVFFVPVDYEDESFWEEVEAHSDQYLQIPVFDYEQERLLVLDFIKGIGNPKLKGLLENALAGRRAYGRLEEILSFYPEEEERLLALREELIADRIRTWLEEHDIFPASGMV